MMDDAKTIEYILQGKVDHYSTLMNKYHNEIFSFVFNMLGNYDDTEDLVQDIFIKTFNSLKKFNKEKASFRTWLYRIASNHTLNYLKSSQYKKKSKNELDTSYLEDDSDIEEEVIKEKQIKEIIDVMKRVLNEKHQKIMMLHYFSGMTVKDISNTLDIPEKTIYKALKSSVEKIQKEVTTNET